MQPAVGRNACKIDKEKEEAFGGQIYQILTDDAKLEMLFKEIVKKESTDGNDKFIKIKFQLSKNCINIKDTNVVHISPDLDYTNVQDQI